MFTDPFADQVAPILAGRPHAVGAQDAMVHYELGAKGLAGGGILSEFAFGGAQVDRAAGYAFPRMHAMAFHSGFDETVWQHRAAANDASGVFDSAS